MPEYLAAFVSYLLETRGLVLAHDDWVFNGEHSELVLCETTLSAAELTEIAERYVNDHPAV